MVTFDISTVQYQNNVKCIVLHHFIIYIICISTYNQDTELFHHHEELLCNQTVVKVYRNLFETGCLVQPEELTLGPGAYAPAPQSPSGRHSPLIWGYMSLAASCR